VVSREPVVVGRYAAEHLDANDNVRDAIADEGIVSMVCAPMVRGDRAIGALYVGSRRPMPFGPDAVAPMLALAEVFDTSRLTPLQLLDPSTPPYRCATRDYCHMQ